MTSSEKATDSSYPILSQIDSPSDVRKLQVAALPELCGDIRRFLINSLSNNPGHFASSMGAVELTVALHYVFNTPYDRIVWDVGHQAYGHKLLTGRRDAFATNRMMDGLSGFPNPEESEYDTFIAGHASNSISAALGMAVATQLKTDEPQRQVVAVIGDASISGGLAFEGLNNAANTPNNLLIILNDNNMSIDANVGALHSHLANVTTSRGYNDLRYTVYNMLKKMHLLSDKRKGSILRLNNSLKAFITHEQNIFEGLNIRYFGPVDGHDVTSLVKILRDIKDMTGPKILHIKTVKGKGYAPAEKDPTTWHAPGKFNPETGERLADLKKDADHPKPPKFQDVFGHTMVELARDNRSIVGITAAMPSGTSMNILHDAFPDRVFDVGISEGHAVTFAGGLAKEGLHPFVAIYSSFLQRSYDNIIHDVAIQQLPVTFCIDRAGLVGEDGVTHHGLFDIAYMRAIPGMVIASPRDEAVMRNLLYTASLYHAPMAIRYPRGAGEMTNWQTPIRELEIGKGEKLTDGNDLTIISTGPIASEVRKAIKQLNERGISVAHYDMTFIKPLDIELLKDAVAKGSPIITIEDGTTVGGLGSAVEEYLQDEGFLNIPVKKLGINDMFVTQGTVSQLRHLCGIDAEAIVACGEQLRSKKS
jgi:1-deoxy-D-xylulose-5-phosphate synthase